MNHACPHCGYSIKSEELWDKKQPLFKNYRVCPHCDKPITVDRKTHRRQLLLIILSFILLFVLFLPFGEAKIAAGVGLIVIILYVIYANKQMRFEVKNDQ